MPGNSQIPWKSISAESVAIVVSILLAFAIDAWWEERRERRFEQEALVSLKSEYEDHRESIEWQLDFHLATMRATTGLMAACQSGSFQSTEFTIDDAIWYFQVPVTTDLGSGARDALISAGRIEVLQNRELRHDLAAWDSVLLELADNQLFNVAYVRESILPYFTRHGISLSGAHDLREGREWPVPARLIAEEPETIERLVGDPEFCAIVDIRYGELDHLQTEYEDLLESIERILERIEQSS